MNRELRQWILLVEAMIVDRAQVIGAMLDSLNTGKYWGNGKMGNDDIYDMFSTFEDELPPKIRKLESNQAIKTPEFQKLLGEWAEARFAEVQTKLSRVPLTNNQYHLHRVIRVPKNWYTKIRQQGQTSLGIYWTYDLTGWDEEIGVHPVWGDKKRGIDVLIEATVAPRYVDWFTTFLANMDWYSGDREYEMTVRAGSPMTVIKITESDTVLDTRGIRFVA